MAGPYRFATWEHLPIVFNDDEAWLLSAKTGKWEPIHTAEARVNGRLMTEALSKVFKARFPAKRA